MSDKWLLERQLRVRETIELEAKVVSASVAADHHYDSYFLFSVDAPSLSLEPKTRILRTYVSYLTVSFQLLCARQDYKEELRLLKAAAAERGVK